MGILFIKSNKLNLSGFNLEKAYVEGIYAPTPQNKKKGIDGTPYKKDINKKEDDRENRKIIVKKFQENLKLKEELKNFLNQLEILLKKQQIEEKKIEKELIGVITNYLLIKRNKLTPQILLKRIIKSHSK